MPLCFAAVFHSAPLSPKATLALPFADLRIGEVIAPKILMREIELNTPYNASAASATEGNGGFGVNRITANADEDWPL